MRAGPLIERLGAVDAVVFDTDGVLIDSARLHAAAWKETFDAYLREHPPRDPAQRRPFDTGDYRRHVDGKSRLDGAVAFLASRKIHVPAGTPEDPPGSATAGAIAARKEQLFAALLRERGVETWPGTVRLLRALEAEGVPHAAVSASRHARDLLAEAGLLGLLHVVVDGVEAARLGLPGKPDPALFLTAAARLGVPAAAAAVAEDALAGVEAGRRGGFGLVIGVDRTEDPGTAAELLAHGADMTVTDLSQLLSAPEEAPEEESEGNSEE
ncbi:HAD-IA family hydrolase [Streptomyces sp. ODS28]|uniref:HAD family hydrolase n=1 Tax=Streptomyces sp. ODS28 TaxID=3136688 RepID=UPI0031EEECEF